MYKDACSKFAVFSMGKNIIKNSWLSNNLKLFVERSMNKLKHLRFFMRLIFRLRGSTCKMICLARYTSTATVFDIVGTFQG